MAVFLVYFTQYGSPATGLSPTWSSLHDTNGTDKSGQGPSISEIGGGWYKFELTKGSAPWDGTDLVGVIDGGPSLSGAERYLPVIISEQTLERQADLTLREPVTDHKDTAGSLAADVNLVRQAVAGKRTQEIATGVIKIYDRDDATVLKTLTPDEQNGILTVDDD